MNIAAAVAAAPPLRFLFIVLALWTAIRIAAFWPWGDVPAPARPRPANPLAPTEQTYVSPSPIVAPPPPPAAETGGSYDSPSKMQRTARIPPLLFALGREAPRIRAATSPNLPTIADQAPPAPIGLSPPVAASRWSGSAWLLVRDDLGPAPLAPAGTLGGSQLGGRLLYRLNGDTARPLALSGRIYAPLRRFSGAEAAVGLDWQPLRRLPFHILAERRQALGRAGRSAFALTLYGGRSMRLLRRARIDAYGQAGIVGVKSRDLFVDGAVQVQVPAGPVEIGAGAWGAAQPGAARLDVGPLLSLPLSEFGAPLRLSAGWRFRVAGEAAPASGPALTLGADF